MTAVGQVSQLSRTSQNESQLSPMPPNESQLSHTSATVCNRYLQLYQKFFQPFRSQASLLNSLLKETLYSKAEPPKTTHPLPLKQLTVKTRSCLVYTVQSLVCEFDLQSNRVFVPA